MRYRNLGKSGIQVSEIGLGTWPAGGSVLLGGVPTGYGDVPASEASRAIERALALGVSFFDTSDSYGLGRAERLLGAALAARRGQAVIATKAGWVPDGAERWMKDLSADHLRAAAQRSCERLGVDRLDVFQLHAIPEEGRETDEALDALEDLKERGVVRLAGASVGADFEAGRRLVDGGRIDTLQVHYNLLQQGAAAELLDEAAARGVGVIASVPLAHGFLAGGYTRATRFTRSDWRSRLKPEEISARVECVSELRFLGRGARSLAQAALQFVLAHPAVSTTIPGFRNEEQVEDLVASLAVPALSDIEVARARELGREWSRPVAADA
jgi:aryl-alcohol dehydrogenase-like predicted oxidoreductase